MKCPKCDQSVAYTMRDASLTMWDVSQPMTYAIIENGLVVETTVGAPIELHDCPERVKSDDELRDEWWIEARDWAFKYECPDVRCGAAKNSSCRHLSTGTANKWPHKDRVAVAVTPEFYDKGHKKGWI